MKNNIPQALQPLTANQAVFSAVMQSNESEQRKIIMLLDRIKTKNGSVQHFIKYLSLVLI